MNFSKINWKQLIISIIICQIPGIFGGFITVNAIQTWYAYLQKPTLVPPNWSFSIVWTLLYLLMGISLYIVWQKGWSMSDVKTAMSIFIVQLFFNFLWSYLFFGLRSPQLGLAGITLLWILIVVNIIQFYRISRPAGLLLVPYILWVSFAAYLNYSIMVLNP
ncbi:TspO and MBR related proteins [Methanolobus vulcani]|jgi:tryptophan-rich sensory protein|uniref:TspO and MBR related proteins n=1 Tax=Methanolobus vulcani TaxID=38026 RepID=A0A7Z7FE64_9EURY|nr:TspO/MBR family protein [Methanolobus vulcani]MDK2826759.1 translocator protein [Methanolobus sp.]MDK2947654.1 translocator protein [Methanolobus sp.]SDF80296.1 TspO and MBR related proteins [Methanolobus vulcani]